MRHAAVQSRPPPPVSVRATAAYDQRNPPSHCSERCLQWPSVPPPSRAAGRGGRTQRARGSGEGSTYTAHEGSGEERITHERRDAVRRIRLVALRARTLCPPHPAEVKIQKPATTSTGAALAVYETTRYGLPALSVVGGARAGAPPLVPHTGVALVSRGHGAFENAALAAAPERGGIACQRYPRAPRSADDWAHRVGWMTKKVPHVPAPARGGPPLLGQGAARPEQGLRPGRAPPSRNKVR